MAQRGQWKLQSPKELDFTGYKGTYFFKNGIHTAVVRNIEKRDRVMETFYNARRLDKDYGTGEVQTPPNERDWPEVQVPSGVRPDVSGSEESPADGRDGAGGAEAGSEGSVPSGDGREHPGHDGDDPIANRLQSALEQLDHGNDDHWTKNGAPRIDAVEKFFGGAGITRKDIQRIAPKLVREQSVE